MTAMGRAGKSLLLFELLVRHEADLLLSLQAAGDHQLSL